jgi:hypothetical protein
MHEREDVAMTSDLQEPIYEPAVASIEVRCEKNHTRMMARLSSTPQIPFFNWLFAYYGCSVCGSKSITPVDVQPVPQMEKTTVLKMLHEQFNQEITRYRDYEWKIILWSLALSWGVFLASKLHIRGIEAGDLRTFSDLLLIGIVILGTLLLATHLLFVHSELTTNRNWREQTRRLMGVYQRPTPFPCSWESYLYQFKSGRDDFVIPFVLFMLISGLSVSYLIACQHDIPYVITAMGSTVVGVWRWWLPSLIVLLFLVAFGYVVGAIWRQGEQNLIRKQSESEEAC